MLKKITFPINRMRLIIRRFVAFKAFLVIKKTIISTLRTSKKCDY